MNPIHKRPNVIEALRALNKLSVNLETQSNPIINRLMFTVYLWKNLSVVLNHGSDFIPRGLKILKSPRLGHSSV